MEEIGDWVPDFLFNKPGPSMIPTVEEVGRSPKKETEMQSKVSKNGNFELKENNKDVSMQRKENHGSTLFDINVDFGIKVDGNTFKESLVDKKNTRNCENIQKVNPVKSFVSQRGHSRKKCKNEFNSFIKASPTKDVIQR
ncbi:hypothetical protein Hanom_Chr04g00379191 [Helianthus anomalus]